MALPEYPSQLPMPDLPGYALQPVSPFRRTPMASGRGRRRRMFTSVPVHTPLTITMTLPQFQLFEGWFRWTISDGADWFMGWAKTSLGVGRYEMAFVDIYQAIPLSAWEWQVSATMEIRERQTIGEIESQFPDIIINQSLFDRTMNKHWPES
ncbi:hypothetical protein [Zobellella sp. DQSA1]|uniref:hypothetical protein n=1 Tax=Zobellella sp. DQSA1 TaxID=3342386 RepID=UPI0035C19BC6